MSIFGRSEQEEVFFQLCKILALNGNAFRQIELNEVESSVQKIWNDPGTAYEVFLNIRRSFHQVAPYVESAEKAASVSPACKKVLFE